MLETTILERKILEAESSTVSRKCRTTMFHKSENSAHVSKENEADISSKRKPWRGCAFEAPNEEKGQQNTPKLSHCTKEQQEDPYNTFQSPQFQVNSPNSFYFLAQKGKFCLCTQC